MLLLAYTGIRWGEAIGLRVRDVEFLKRRLMVSENAVHSASIIPSGQPRVAWRSVPVPQFVLNALSEQCKDNKPNDLVFPARDRRLPAASEIVDWVVSGRGLESEGTEDNTPRSPADMREPRGQRWGECASTAAHV